MGARIAALQMGTVLRHQALGGAALRQKSLTVREEGAHRRGEGWPDGRREGGERARRRHARPPSAAQGPG